MSHASGLRQTCPIGDGKLSVYRNSGNRKTGGAVGSEKTRGVMKNLKRILFGVLSSLLFATGFARAAEQLDPVSRAVTLLPSDSVITSTLDTSTECAIDDVQ